MGADGVAVAFAQWAEAHKRYIEAERRLAIAARVSRGAGGLPPLQLEGEVKTLKEEADRLLALAQAELKRKEP